MLGVAWGVYDERLDAESCEVEANRSLRDDPRRLGEPPPYWLAEKPVAMTVMRTESPMPSSTIWP